MSAGLCTHRCIILGLPLNPGVLVLIFFKLNNKRAPKHALFQERRKAIGGERHGLSTQNWGRERKGKIRSTLSFTNLDTVSSLKWGQNSKMAGSTAAALGFLFIAFYLCFIKKAFLDFDLRSAFPDARGQTPKSRR